MNRAAIFDAAERIFWTAIQTFGGALIASPIFEQLGLGWQDALKIAAATTALSVLKQIVAIAATQNGTPQLGVDTYDNKPDTEVTGPGG